MEIRWGNIFAVLLIIFGIYLFVKMRPFLENIFENLNSYSWRHDDPTMTVIVLGFLCITVLGIVKIISKRR
jgi:hypothetical protein